MKSVKVTNNHIRQNKKGYGAAGSIYVGFTALFGGKLKRKWLLLLCYSCFGFLVCLNDIHSNQLLMDIKRRQGKPWNGIAKCGEGGGEK